MNRKNITKAISMALVLGLAPTLMPSTLNLGTEAVYAASSSGYITNVKLETNKDKSVSVYTKDSYKSKYKLSNIDDTVPTKLYAKVDDNVKKVKVTDIDLGTNCDSVKIYKGSTEIDKNEEVSISSSLTLQIKAYSGSTLKETYTIKIRKEDSSSSSDDNDDIYLDDLSLEYDNDDVDIDFDKEKSSYNVDVKNKISYVKVYANPDDNDYTVKINGHTVNDDDDWREKVSLSEGKNTITVKVKDDDSNEREYKLNITRASSSTSSSKSSSSSSKSSSSNSSSSSNNTSSSSTTNTNSSANLSTSLSEGWQQIGADWYFIAPDGTKQTGWQKIDGRWYYMNENGTMQVGWFNSPYSGKWYYLNPISNGYKGAMVANTVIDGYSIGFDGARR